MNDVEGEVKSIRCPWCTTPQSKAEATLGAFGRLIHYRCRFCAGDWHKEAK